MDNINNALDYLKAIVDNTTDAIYVKDIEGKYLFFNKFAEKFVGKKAEDVLGKDDYALFLPDDAKAMMQADKEVMIGGLVKTYEEKLTTAEGDVLTFLSTKGPIFDKQGKVAGIFGISRDVTRIKEHENCLKMAQIAARLGNWEWDLKTQEVYWADENYEIHGIDRKAKPSYEGFLKVIDPAERENVEKIINEVLVSGKPLSFYYTAIRPDNGKKVILYSTADVIKNKSGKVIKMVGIVQDVTVVKNLENELQAKLKDLEKLNKFMIGRELRIVELKKEIKELKSKKL